MEKSYTVYIHKNKINGKVYVGVTSLKPEHRWEKNGTGYENNKYFSNSISKYGWDDGFEHIIVAVGLTKEQACKMEIDLIAKYDSTNPKKGYNISPGGSLRGEKGDRIVSEKLKGHTVSKETREKLRITSTNWYATHDNPRKGYVKSEEEIMVDVLAQPTRKVVLQIDLETGNVINEFPSIQQAAKLINGNARGISLACHGKCRQSKGYGWQFKDNPMPYVKNTSFYCPVAQIEIETNKVINTYNSIKEAENATNSRHISDCCRGKQKVANGYKWKYVEDLL